MAFIECGDVRIHYEQYGKGGPVLLLHGNGENGHYFDRLCDALKDHFQLIVMDTRGHGTSSWGMKTLCYETIQEDVKALLDGLALTRVHLLGFSDGANAAMYFTYRYPAYVKRLVLNGGNLNPCGIRLQYQLPIVLKYACLLPFAHGSENVRRQIAYVKLMVHHPHIHEVMLKEIRIPVQVIVGTRDMVKRAHSIHIAKVLLNAQFIELEGTHFIARDASEQFAMHVRSFLGSS